MQEASWFLDFGSSSFFFCLKREPFPPTGMSGMIKRTSPATQLPTSLPKGVNTAIIFVFMMFPFMKYGRKAFAGGYNNLPSLAYGAMQEICVCLSVFLSFWPWIDSGFTSPVTPTHIQIYFLFLKKKYVCFHVLYLKMPWAKWQPVTWRKDDATWFLTTIIVPGNKICWKQEYSEI